MSEKKLLKKMHHLQFGWQTENQSTLQVLDMYVSLYSKLYIIVCPECYSPSPSERPTIVSTLEISQMSSACFM